MTVAMERELLRMSEVAEILGIGRSHCYELAQRGELPGVIRLGNSMRVSRRLLVEWIEQNASRPAIAAGR